MSNGLICLCADDRHPIDPRSEVGELGVWNRCRSYAADQQHGGVCSACAVWRHRELRGAPKPNDHGPELVARRGQS